MTILRQKDKLFFRRSRAALVAALLALAFIAAPVQAAIRYVDLDGANTGDCSAPGTACNTITRAIDQATAGDDIYVARGTYTETQILVSKQVTITGGFNPTGPTLWDTTNYTFTPTILDGQNTERPLYIPVDDVVIQFLTIQKGNATTAAPSTHFGGGILVSNATGVILRGLKVIDNVASTTELTNSSGGGVALVGNSSLNIERTLILSNTTLAAGGGVGVRADAGQDAILNFDSTVLAHNSAVQGGAFATSGAGSSFVDVAHTTLGDNKVGAADEAIFMTEGNDGTSLNFSYSLLTGNTTALRSTTVANPQMLSTGVIMHPNVVNDWMGMVPNLIPALRRELPFANPAAGDYHLVAGSPAIDIAGNTVKIDLEGRKRVISDHCTPFTLCPLGRSDDYGAYEYVNTSAVVRYVAREGDDNNNNCLDRDLPCETLHNANIIVLGGDEIRLAQGIYQSSDSSCANSAVICVRQGITLTGGFTLTNWNTPSTNPILTVLDGATARQGIRVDYDAPNGSSLIRNITVRNGYSFANGGGIAINTQNIGRAQNLTIRNCLVEESKGDNSGDGGGIFANEPDNLRVENCILTGNYVPDGRGGGLAINDANGTATYTLTNLTVYNNQANRPNDMSANGGMGGGVFLQGIGTLRQSEIYSNTAAFSGGGVTTGSNNAHPIVDRVYIHDNQASLGGGFSIFVTGGATLQNSLLARNAATSTVGLLTGQTNEPMLGGNAIHSPYIGVPSEPLTVTNVTIVDNDGAVDDAVTVEGLANVANTRINDFTNVLISGNLVGIRSDSEGIANLVKVLMTTDVITKTDNFGAGRLTGTPLTGNIGFVGSGDYHLLPGADGVDDGDTVAGITEDLDGVSRPIGAAFDIGAYETTLQKQNQTITFAPIANRALSESPIPVQPTSSSGLPVQLISPTPAVCAVASNSITLLTEGTCSIQASQLGNAAFNAAPTVTRSFEVGIEVPQETLHLPALDKQ